MNSHLLWFCIPALIDWFKNSRHFLNQSEVKPKPIVTRLRTFSRASSRLHVFGSSFDWITGLSVSFVIGQSDYIGFGYGTLSSTYVKHDRRCFIVFPNTEKGVETSMRSGRV